MAFYNKADDLSRDPTIPRDPAAIDQRYTRDDSIISAVLILLVVAAAFGLYFLYANSDSSSRTVNQPSTTQLAPAPAPAPATQPPTQTPTP